VPDAIVGHAAGAAASQAFGDEQTRVWLRASYEWMRRRRGRLVTGAFAALSIGGAAARAALTLLPGSGARDRRGYWRAWAALHRSALRSSRSSSR
jgi:hypothetical protein